METHLNIEASATVKMNGLAVEKRRSGTAVYNLSAGEAMVDTPLIVVDAATRAMKEGKTHYTPAAGISELRMAAANWMNEWYGSNFSADETLVSCGGKFDVFALLQAYVQPGDEVIIAAPYWVSYASLVRLFGGVSKIVETSVTDGWKMHPQQVEDACTKKTKILIFNNGSNPCGTLYTKDEVEKILHVAQEKNIFVISDEVYSGLVYDDHRYISAGLFPEYKKNISVVQSCSKNFGMTGWRVGFLFAPKEVIDIISMLQSQSTTGTSTISQWAALAAVENARTIIPVIKQEMQARRDVFVKLFKEYFGIAIEAPPAALYTFLPLNLFGKETNSEAFCLRLLEEANVASVPGSAFGQEGYVRFSFGETEEQISKGVEALAKWCQKG